MFGQFQAVGPEHPERPPPAHGDEQESQQAGEVLQQGHCHPPDRRRLQIKVSFANNLLHYIAYICSKNRSIDDFVSKLSGR